MPETEESLTVVRSLIRILEGEKEIRKSLDRKSMENEQFEIRTIQNNVDVARQQDNETLALLSSFQHIVNAQLPAMPAEYVSRLMYDERHLNHVLLERDVGVRGGICCRRFERFLEIAFCAVTTTEQLKGYGTMLMDFLKDWMLEQGIYHIVTYADQNAMEWFGKKGFTETPQLDPKLYKNRIKEYEGATLMGFDIDSEYLVKKFPDFSRRLRLLHKASEEDRVEKSHPPEHQFRLYRGIEHVFREGPLPLCLPQIPGTRTLGIHDDAEFHLEPVDPFLNSKISRILEKLGKEPCSRPFRVPVDGKLVPEYYRWIRHPIDLKTMRERHRDGYYCHQHLLIADLTRMFRNCYTFNEENTVYYRYGYELNKLTLLLLKSEFPDSELYPELPKKKPRFYM